VPGDTNGVHDIFVHDRDADGDGVFDEPGAIATRRVSVSSTGAQGNHWSFGPSLSADGRFVAFSSASNLVPGDTNCSVFIHDRDADGDGVFDEPGAIATRCAGTGRFPSVSADGRVVAFTSEASNLVPGDTNDSEDIFVHDRDADGNGLFDEPGARTTRRVSVSSTGVQANGYSDAPRLSADGRVVAFRSESSNLVHRDTNGVGDVFVHDRLGRVEAVCAGFAATLLGTPGPDHLVGDAGPDVIHGLEGNDVLEGGEGDDLLCGGDDQDTLLGGAGKDRLVGGMGHDRLLGGTGHDKLFGRDGADQLFGGDGRDWLVGDAGADRLFGEADNDRLVGGPGDDLLDGGDGQDRCEGGEDAAGDSAVACEMVVDIP
jgi:Ca2+-binding RTX toxin-like protein